MKRATCLQVAVTPDMQNVVKSVVASNMSVYRREKSQGLAKSPSYRINASKLRKTYVTT